MERRCQFVNSGGSSSRSSAARAPRDEGRAGERDGDGGAGERGGDGLAGERDELA